MTTLFKMLHCIIFSLSFASLTYENPIRIAVIDSGLDLNDPRFATHICKTGSKDFTGYGIVDNLSHGTHVAGLIKQYAEDADYCLIILKFYEESQSSEQNIEYTLQALREAVRLNVDFVNYSAGGTEFISEEKEIIENAPNITFVVAAGNNGESICYKNHSYYPACHHLKNIVVVGNIKPDGSIAKSSNRGKIVDAWEMGQNILSTFPNNQMGRLGGSSMSCAVHTGKLVKRLYDSTH